MKRTFHKNILRTIGGSLSRFLAIFSIVGLGVGFFAGLLASPGDMRLSADAYYRDTNMYDLRIVSTLGLTEKDAAAVEELEAVEQVMPARDRDGVYLSEEGDVFTARLHTLPEDGVPALNTPVLQEGRLPEKPGECAVVLLKSFSQEENWIGQRLTLQEEADGDQRDNEEEEGELPGTLTVVGTLKSAVYLSMESERSTVGSGSVNLVCFVTPDSMPQDYYTGLYVTLAGDSTAFSQAYEQLLEEQEERMEALGEERAALRRQELVDEATQKLDDAKQEYSDAKEEADQALEDAFQQLEDGDRQIEENRQKLEDAKQEIQDGREELEKSRAEAESQLADAQSQIDQGYSRIADAQRQIDSGWTQLRSARTQLQEGEAALKEAEDQLAAAKAELDSQEAQLTSLVGAKAAFWEAAGPLLPEGLSGDQSDAAAIAAIAALSELAPEQAEAFLPLKAGLETLAAQGKDTASAAAELEQGKAAYQENLTAVSAQREELEKNKALLDQQESKLNGSQAQLDSQKRQLNSSAAALRQSRADTEAQLSQAQQELDDAQQEVDDGEKELASARKELAQGRKEYQDKKTEAQEELDEAWEEIEEAQGKIDDIPEGEWILFTRKDNAAYDSYGGNADKIAAIASVFPAFFFLVSALVALTTMTRMVEEERGQIGTMKALGYSGARIASKYLLYAALAGIGGSAVGLALGMRIFPSIIIAAYNIMYDVPKALTPFNVPCAAASSVLAVAVTLAATLSACWGLLRETPASLMLPKAPPAGKRVFLEYITPLWSRMRFTHKVTARNLIRYKKRFFMTVIGIAGCTALLVTGFGLRDSIFNIVGLQYGELNQYQLMVALGDEKGLEDPQLRVILEDKAIVSDSLPVMQNSGSVVPKPGDPADSVTLFVPSDVGRLPEYFHFRHRESGEEIPYDEDAVIITEKLAERQHLRVGDPITLKNQGETQATLTVTDICENYVYHMAFLSPRAYEEAFGEPPEWDSVLCMLPEDGENTDDEALSSRLIACDDVVAVLFTRELSESFSNTIKSLNIIVYVLIISAGALAFVVLYNLTNINISERVKEIATIKVLGFYDLEVSAYIYRENVVLTLIGTGVGLILGIFLHQFVIRTAEIDMVMFGRVVYPISYLWSALLTILFSAFVNLVMHSKLKRISMVESMKAPE